MTDDEWLALIRGVDVSAPAGLDELRRQRAVLMDRITAIDDLIAEHEPDH